MESNQFSSLQDLIQALMMSHHTATTKKSVDRTCTVSKFVLCFCAFFLVSIGGFLTWWSSSLNLNDKIVGTKPTPVIIFKLPRTGSSWFTQELNSIPTVYISKEILQRGDHGKFSSQEIEAQLIQALTSPTGKMSSKDRWSPDGRYIEDYLMHKTLKPFRSLDVIGFSVNPEHCRNINWHHVIAAVPTLKIIKFIRTNVIKMAISGHRGQQTQTVCGGSNVRDTLHSMGVPKDNCVLPATVNWTMQEFGKEVSYWQTRNDAFMKFFESRDDQNQSSSRGFPSDMIQSIVIPYEDMQTNAEKAFRKLFAFLDKSHAYEAYYRSSGGAKSNGGGWVKRTPEDLSQLLTSFREIQGKLSTSLTSTMPPPIPPSTKSNLPFGSKSEGNTSAASILAAASSSSPSSSSSSSSSITGGVGGCRCWHDQLISTVAQVFPYCTAPIITVSASANSVTSATIIANSSVSVSGTSNMGDTHGCLF